MLYLGAVLLCSLIGLEVDWSAEPASGSNEGILRVEVTLRAEDFLFVQGEEETASYEVVATTDGGGYARRAGTALRNRFPLTVSLELSGVAPGERTMTVTTTDLESDSRTSTRKEVFVPRAGRLGWTAGNPRLPDGTSVSAEGSVRVVWELYPPTGTEALEDLRSAYLLRGENGTVFAEGWMTRTGEGSNLIFEASVPVEGLDEGDYEVLTAAVAEEDPVASSSTRLNVLPSWDVWGKEVDETTTLIRPIAKNSDLDRLQDAETRTERQAIMAEFWKRRDPTPLTQENEYLQLYLRRLRFTENRYGVLGTRGVNTDRGRVYLLLGQPDILEDRPMEYGTLPYQVWTYFTPSLTVVFVDYSGYGLYELATPWEDVMDESSGPLYVLGCNGGPS
ncbi:GWxTD domain-containing protein [Candidatus Fermentibacteria bacterium]|nr:GWxTD domain-containing protein [Candidatus Fermentibacteria bacterium]